VGRGKERRMGNNEMLGKIGSSMSVTGQLRAKVGPRARETINPSSPRGE